MVNEPANPDANTPPANPDGNQPPAPAPAAPPAPAPAPPAEPSSQPPNPNPKLQSERDKLKDKVSTLESFLEPIAVERAVGSFLDKNKEKFPDLTAADFEDIPDISDEYMTKHATRLQTRFQEHAQKKILEIENPEVPKMTLEERNAEIEKLRNSKDPASFGKYLSLIQAA